MDSKYDLALSIAVAAHAGQTDKSGAPYILHPLRVALRAINRYHQVFSYTKEDVFVVAILHDVVEDTKVTLGDIADKGFSPTIIKALQAITKSKSETREQYAARTRLNPLALYVKLNDIADNSSEERLSLLSKEDHDKLKLKYEKALKDLLGKPKEASHV